MNKLLISVSGVRGIVGKALTPEVALKFGLAFGRYLKKGRVFLGRDTRYHGPMIFSAVAAGLMASGRDVIDIGVVSTPAAEYAVRESNASGGIVVTASHNPIEYNALKFIGSGGMFLTESQSEKFMEYYNNSSNPPKSTSSKIGSSTEQYDWDIKHIKAILDLSIIKPATIKRRKFKVAADCVNATASYVAAELFNSLGCSLTLINAMPDGKFPRPPEPAPENLKKLSRAVKKFKADIGFAFDPDADRMAIVDEKGKPIGEEYTLALGMRYILSQDKGPVAVNLSSSMINDFVASEAGVRLFRTKVGEINVTEKLRRIRGVAGGEGNGGLIYPEMHYGRDGLMASAIILQYMASSRKTISDLAGELPVTKMVKRKLKITRRSVNFNKIVKAFRTGLIDATDGIKIIFDDSWVQIRLSNTEPIARLISEAYDSKKAISLADEIERLIA